MVKNILITGATGLIGDHIVKALLNRGDKVNILTTDTAGASKKLPADCRIVSWKDYLLLADNKIDAVINLAGKNIGENRWNNTVKKDIYDSRVQSTRKIIELIGKMDKKPGVLINASGVDYYGNRGDEEITEDSPPGYDFLSGVCIDWEKEAYNAEDFGVRVVIIRNGFVMAKNAKAINRLTLPYKFYIGGTIGSGRQYMSWIHIDDLTNIYLLAIDNSMLNGSVNASAPNPVTMKEFCKNIAEALRKPAFFKVPSFMVKIAAGEMAQVVLHGRKAVPEKLINLGFNFKYVSSFNTWKDILA